MYEKIYLVKMGPIFVGSAFVSSTFLGIRDGKAVLTLKVYSLKV